MQKLLILIILLEFAFLSSFAQPTDHRTGNWIGAIRIIGGADLPIYFRITGDSLSGYKGDWNSPVEKALGLPYKTLTISGDSLLIDMSGIVASYRGRYLPGLDSVRGAWKQNGEVCL